jgi:GrpB-like predicted nucleotidyltransferase (UPF0157 family)/GNAT superfamily N-acetyltransferase
MAHEGHLRVEAYDPTWPDTFEGIRTGLEPILDGTGASIDHVGSTAIPGMPAKPILDIDFVVPTPADIATVIGRLENRGYRPKGDRGIVGREMLEPPADLPFHHAYVVVRGSPAHLDHTIFRDYLIEHGATATEYAELKRVLGPLLRFDRQMYTDAKIDFVAGVLERARHDAGIPAADVQIFDGVSYRWRAPIEPGRIDVFVGIAFDGTPRDGWWRRARPRSLGWVTAHADDELVGFVNVISDGGVHAFVLDTAVAENVRRQSIGEHLVEIAAEHARQAACDWLHVDFEEHFTDFYLKACGFSSTTAGLIALR